MNEFDSTINAQLYLACKDGKLERVKLLLQLGASPNVKDIEYNISTLAAACMTHCTTANRRQRDIVELLLQHGGDANLQDNRGMTILHHLSHLSQDYKMVRLIINFGKADLDVQNLKKGDTPLHLLCRFETESDIALKKAKCLLQAGANPCLLNSEMQSAICIAANKAKSKLLAVLLSKSADPNGNALAQCTPIESVAKGYVHHRENHFSNYYTCIDILQAKGANINTVRASRFNSLDYTIRYRAFAMTKYLLQKGADPNFQDDSGNTALHKAYMYCTHALSGLADIDKILLEAGSNPNVHNDCNDVPASNIPYFDFVSSNRELWFLKIKQNLQAGLEIRNLTRSHYQKVNLLPLTHSWYDAILFLHNYGHWFNVTDQIDGEVLEYVKILQKQPISLQMAAARIVRHRLKPNAIKGTIILNLPATISKLITLDFGS